ncbi:DNA endonuclease III [Schizosaccharomyces cryophilus OY26]|uniref:DNA-(apurinic or apyrimidinic site) lyase n=1 Tax=Schizosaccharomyces cryophilus (strain OY26 / ATCC MYA-4695 / CBS 11777 / NBRC 106824 / NRRL Y48691) TaxID=653667 RepID=S9VXE2_SCHCR|nr:DNA endonuclease III [Schizosaccharomyces cryophilus OY26]EPY50829.1 DNA endonuclease III [Schizosaccharomyces cryophilus OY26]
MESLKSSQTMNENFPDNWETVYNEIREMKKKCSCSRGRTRFTYTSQTKDTVLGPTMKNLKENLPQGLCLRAIREIDEDSLNKLIEKVGFHNRKTIYLKQMAQILEEKYDGDIPKTVEELMSIPGVGPKMGYLCMGIAWDKIVGIGVDVHVHRISNILGWCHTKTEEQTRLALQSFLPKHLWHEVNYMLVGFGQTICLPRGRRCDICTLASKGLCPSAYQEKSLVSAKRSKTTKKVKKRSPTASPEVQVTQEQKTEYDVIPTGLNELPSDAVPEKKVKLESSVGDESQKESLKEQNYTENADQPLRRYRRTAAVASEYFSRQHLQDIEDLF